jgi:hypothetical protein
MNSKKLYKPQRISIISSSITKDIFKKRGFKEQKILTNWKDIVGDEIGSYTIPESLTQNKLLIVKCSSSHALEFQYAIPKIIDRISFMMGYKAITNIKIKQGTIENENKTIIKKKNTLSTKENNILKSILNKVKDEKLKENLNSFVKSFFSKIK